MKAVFDWFAHSGQAGFATAMVSVISAIVAGVALVKSWSAQSALVRIERARETDRVKQMLKANLAAKFALVPSGKGSRGRLSIINTGPGEARSIAVTIEGKSVMDCPAVPRGIPEIRQVGPHSEFHYPLLPSSEVSPPFDVTITWTDDSGEPGSYRTTLSY